MHNSFSEKAWEEYLYWQKIDADIAGKINELIKAIHRNGAEAGIGKPEPLRYHKGWNRRINYEHRLVYFIENDILFIVSCIGHYE